MEWRLQPNTRDVISELALIRHVKQFVPTWLDDVRREIAEAHNTRQTQVIVSRPLRKGLNCRMMFVVCIVWQGGGRGNCFKSTKCLLC